MFDVTTLLSVGGTAALLVVILQVLKTYVVGQEAKKYIPLMGMALGVVLVDLTLVVVNGGVVTAVELESGTITGFLAGAASSGFWDTPAKLAGR
ncbi:MAG: hypothetical protein M1358_15745 [Chloroflexi bacterium]|nr:hypothetical protein [Chloroflexota bacterium]